MMQFIVSDNISKHNCSPHSFHNLLFIELQLAVTGYQIFYGRHESKQLTFPSSPSWYKRKCHYLAAAHVLFSSELLADCVKDAEIHHPAPSRWPQQGLPGQACCCDVQLLRSHWRSAGFLLGTRPGWQASERAGCRQSQLGLSCAGLPGLRRSASLHSAGSSSMSHSAPIKELILNES